MLRRQTVFLHFVEFAESDSDVVKGSVQTRHAQTTIPGLDQKNYRQEATIMCCPDDNRFSCL